MRRAEFVPKAKVAPIKRNLRLEFSPEEYARIAALAKEHNCSMKSFGKQAVAFAIEQLTKRRKRG